MPATLRGEAIGEDRPIQPGEPPSTIGQRLRAELRDAPLRLRIVLPIYLLISGFGGIVGGHALTSAYSNWLTWFISLLILEPIGVASLLGVWVMVFPDSRVAGLFERALARAGRAAALVGVIYLGALLSGLLFVLFEWWRLR